MELEALSNFCGFICYTIAQIIYLFIVLGCSLSFCTGQLSLLVFTYIYFQSWGWKRPLFYLMLSLYILSSWCTFSGGYVTTAPVAGFGYPLTPKKVVRNHTNFFLIDGGFKHTRGGYAYDIPPEKYGVSLHHAWGFPEKFKHIKDIDMDISLRYTFT